MPPVDRDEVARSLRDLGPAVPDLIRGARDPGAQAVGTWTVGEVAAHLVSLVELYPRILRGEGSPRASHRDVAADNRAGIARVGTTEPNELAARFAAAAPRCLRALEEAGAEVAWHGGLRLPAETVAAILGAEYAVHGHDIATGADLAWQVPGEHACTVIHGLGPLLPHYVDEEAADGMHARIRVRLRGDHRSPLTLRFRDGTLEVAATELGRADCTISADPETWALVSFGRAGPLWPALTGRLLVWGRRPWLAARLQSLLRVP